MRYRFADLLVSVTGCPNSCAPIPDCRHWPDGRGVQLPAASARDRGVQRAPRRRPLGADAGFVQLALKKVPADYVYKSIAQIVEAYKANRVDRDETFRQFVQRHTPQQLGQWLTIPEMAEVA